MVETDTFTITGPDGDEDEVELPVGLIDVLAEQGDDRTEVVGDVVMMGFAERAHAIVHHSQGEVAEDVKELAEAAEDLFEKRFGISFAEATGHQH
jgi:hypothetical protein